MLKEQRKKAVIYCRVSTKEQVEDGNSLITQEKICKEYALKNNYDIAAVFIELGESAKTIDRTELKKLLSFCAVKSNGVAAVIAYKIDRISRNMDDYSQIRMLFKRYGVEIKSTSENFEDTPAGRFMENILANVAQFDNDVRTERSLGGMKQAVSEGRYVWKAPFGYSNVRINGKSTIAPNENAVVIRKTLETIAKGNYHPEQIRLQMAEEGLTMQMGKNLSKAYYYRLLKNEIYAGWINMFGQRNKGTFEPLISQEIFDKVQMILNPQKRNKLITTTVNADFPLRRFIRHPSGRLLTGAWSTGCKKKYAYYIIHSPRMSFSKIELEDAFIDWVNSFKMDFNHFEKLYSTIKVKLQTNEIMAKENKVRLENRMAALKLRENALINKNIAGVISDDLCKEKLSEISFELFELAKSISNLKETVLPERDLLELIRTVLLQPGELWKQAGIEEKIKLQWFYFPEGIIIDKNGSRTTKICKLFKLKEMIWPYQSPMVNHRNSKSNKNFKQFFLTRSHTADIQSPEFWDDIHLEIAKLKNIISRKETVTLWQEFRPSRAA